MITKVTSSRNGFSLTELMISVAIMGILAAVAVPIYKDYIKDSKMTEAKSNLETLRLLEEQYYNDHGRYTGNVSKTTILDQSSSPFKKGFQPGSKLVFDYTITGNNTAYTITASDPAGAIGNFTINQDNARTGPNGAW